jgi:hypothetical protein
MRGEGEKTHLLAAGRNKKIILFTGCGLKSVANYPFPTG